MAKYAINDTTLTTIAEAIRGKTGSAEQIQTSQMADKIASIQVGDDTSDATATANDIASGKTAYAKGKKVTGNVTVIDGAENISNAAATWVPGDNGGLSVTYTPSQKVMLESGASVVQIVKRSNFGDAQDSDVAQGKTYTSTNGLKRTGTKVDPTSVTRGTPSISVSSSGLITASVAQAAGLVDDGTNSNTKQLDTQAAQTITPGRYDVTIPSGVYLTGTQTIVGDRSLLPEYIRSGITIFGVDGTYKGTYGWVSALETFANTFSTDRDTDYRTSHILGVKPNFLLVFVQEDMSATTVAGLRLAQVVISKKIKRGSTTVQSVSTVYYQTATGSVLSDTLTSTSDFATTTTFTVPGHTDIAFKAGYKYIFVYGLVESVL